MLQSKVSDPSVNMNPKPILYLEKVYARNGDDFGGGGGGEGGGGVDSIKKTQCGSCSKDNPSVSFLSSLKF